MDNPIKPLPHYWLHKCPVHGKLTWWNEYVYVSHLWTNFLPRGIPYSIRFKPRRHITPAAIILVA